MPIATSTIAVAAAVAAGVGYLLTQRSDEKDDFEEEEDEDEQKPTGPISATILGGLDTIFEPTPEDTDYLLEDEGDLSMDTIPGEQMPSQANYPWQTNPPPNSWNYDEELFPDFVEIRKVLFFLGYNTPYTTWGVDIDSPPSPSEVRRFQRHYNEASESGYKSAAGYLKEDGLMGTRSLRALQYAGMGNDGPTLDDVIRGTQWKTEHGLWD